MVYKGCVRGSCESYDSVKIFRLQHTKYSEERQRWPKAIPWENIPDPPNKFICEDHCPKGYKTTCVYGKLRPMNSPSVFTSCVKKSLVPTKPATPRSTKPAHSSTRNTQSDDTEVYIQMIKLPHIKN